MLTKSLVAAFAALVIGVTTMSFLGTPASAGYCQYDYGYNVFGQWVPTGVRCY